jgi:ATP-dependent RNA helicase RhlE
MKFAELNLSKQILKSLESMGLSSPTTIQEKAFSVIMSGRDVVGIAQTGTGKTLAFLLPILNLLKYTKNIEPRVIILVPTRELVLQIVTEIEKLTTNLNIRSTGVYGGANINTQKDILLEGTDILVGTPGRTYDLALSGYLKLKNIQKVIVDEMDEMLNLGFRKQLHNILELLPEKRQNLLFSATIENDIEEVIAHYFNNPIKIEAAPSGTPLESIEQISYSVPNFNTKINFLTYLLDSDSSISKVLIFTKSRKIADLVFEIIDEKYPENFGVIHSNKSQNYRFNALKSFQNETHRGLIATDLVSRGLDISDVTHVINFDMPDEATNYIHRIGRTGRADKTGIAISFITLADASIREQIESIMQMKIPSLEIPGEVSISEILIPMEKNVDPGVNYLPEINLANSRGAFHPKKDKNKKVNLGGSYKREIKLKYKKPKTRGQKK